MTLPEPTHLDVRVGAAFGRVARSGIAEAVLAIVLLLYSETFFSGQASATLTWPQFAADVAVCLGAAASGRWPRTGGVVAGVALLAFPFVQSSGAVPAAIFAVLIPVFATGARGMLSWRWFLTLWYFVGLMAATLPLARDTSEAIQTVVIWVVLLGLVWGLGTMLHALQRRTAALATERVEALRSQRRTIARDLHDTVAYATSMMIMRAEEVKLRGAGDPHLNADLDFIIATGRRSLRDLRGMMEALRRNDPALEAGADAAPWRIVSPGALLTQQVAELRANGLDVQVQVDAHLDHLPESVRETFGKLLVEATSNMVKHAARTGPCRILVEQSPEAVEAVFTNPVGATASDTPGGLGLVGARERVEALGGDLETTEASGTWLLRVSLPVGG